MIKQRKHIRRLVCGLLVGLAAAGFALPAAAQTSSTLFSMSGSGGNGSVNAGPLPALSPTGGTGASTAAPTTMVTPQSVTPTGQNPQNYQGVAAPAAIGATGPVAPTLSGAVQSTGQLMPFGASLFTTTTPPSSLAPNPNYVIQPGDTVSVQAYGGVTAQSTSVVDTQGNVFLPGFGPVHVAGISAANLQLTVQQELAHAFTSNVSVYAVLQTENSISVYVAGFVKAPGQYLGSASDSVLDFLSRAGGVDPSRGSYRDIWLMRGGQKITQIDLYQFLLSGKPLPDSMRTGDTILVGKQEPIVAVGGSVRNNYLFEVPEADFGGQELIDLAHPLPAATNALVAGTRNGQPYSVYVTLTQLAQTPLYDQDQVTFIADEPAQTITVQVQGSRIGPSVLVASRDSTLKKLLAYVAVDPTDADTKSVYIMRPGLAAQQYQSIQAALDRLQKALFYATSVTTGEAQIRATEAQQIQNYINAARTIQPAGILVVADDNNVQTDVRMEDGDTIVIPEKSDIVMVDGEVQAPQAVQYVATDTRDEYIALAGGLTERGRKANTVIKRLSGRLVLDPAAAILPGDELIVLPYVETENFVITEDVLSLIYQVAASTYFASKL